MSSLIFLSNVDCLSESSFLRTISNNTKFIRFSFNFWFLHILLDNSINCIYLFILGQCKSFNRTFLLKEFSDLIIFIHSIWNLSFESILVHMQNWRLCVQNFNFHLSIDQIFILRSILHFSDLIFMMKQKELSVLVHFVIHLKEFLRSFSHFLFILQCIFMKFVNLFSISCFYFVEVLIEIFWFIVMKSVGQCNISFSIFVIKFMKARDKLLVFIVLIKFLCLFKYLVLLHLNMKLVLYLLFVFDFQILKLLLLHLEILYIF